MIKEEVNGRVVYSFPDEECEVPITDVHESLFIEHFMAEGWSEEDCVCVIGGMDGDVDCRLIDAWEVWSAAWQKFKETVSDSNPLDIREILPQELEPRHKLIESKTVQFMHEAELLGFQIDALVMTDRSRSTTEEDPQLASMILGKDIPLAIHLLQQTYEPDEEG